MRVLPQCQARGPGRCEASHAHLWQQRPPEPPGERISPGANPEALGGKHFPRGRMTGRCQEFWGSIRGCRASAMPSGTQAVSGSLVPAQSLVSLPGASSLINSHDQAMWQSLNARGWSPPTPPCALELVPPGDGGNELSTPGSWHHLRKVSPPPVTWSLSL